MINFKNKYIIRSLTSNNKYLHLIKTMIFTHFFISVFVRILL